MSKCEADILIKRPGGYIIPGINVNLKKTIKATINLKEKARENYSKLSGGMNNL